MGERRSSSLVGPPARRATGPMGRPWSRRWTAPRSRTASRAQPRGPPQFVTGMILNQIIISQLCTYQYGKVKKK